MSKVDFILNIIGNADAKARGLQTDMEKVWKQMNFTESSARKLDGSLASMRDRIEDLKILRDMETDLGNVAKLNNQISQLERQSSKLNNLGTGPNSLTGFFGELSSQVPGVGGAMAAMATPMGAAVAGAAAVGYALVDATGKAMNFEAGMAKANGTMQLSKEELSGLTNQLITMGRDSTVELGTIPGAFEKIVSGVGDAKLSMDIMKASLKGAQAASADLNAVADATVNVLNSVGSANTNANEIMDVLFATLNKGKGEFADIASYLPKLIPASNNLGISYKETAGAFAFLTANGLKAEQSTTALQNVFTALGRSGIRDSFKDLGIDIFNSEGKMRALTDISADLGKSLTGLTDEQRVKILESLGLDQEAAMGMAKLSQQVDKLRESVEATVNSQGAMAKTLAASETPSQKLLLLSNQYNALMTKLGIAILPAVNKGLGTALDVVQGIVDGFESAYNNSQLFRDTLSVAWEWMTLGYTLLGKLWNTWAKIGSTIKQISEWSREGNVLEKMFGGADGFNAQIKNLFMGVVEGDGYAYKAIKQLLEGNFEEASRLAGKIGDALNKTEPIPVNTYNSLDYTAPVKPLSFEERLNNNSTIGLLGITPAKASAAMGKADPNVLKHLAAIDKANSDKKSKNAEKLDRVTGGGSKPVNISIQIDALNKGGITVQSTTLTEGVTQIEQMITEMFLRVTNQANQIALG
jgi:TP901 family phage tail tape measure protein